MPEVPNRLQVGTSFDNSIPFINDALNAIDGENRTKIVRNGSTPTILFGYQKDGFGMGVDYGLKVAKAGNNVLTATTDQLAFSSAFDHLRVAASGTATITVPASMTSLQVATTTVAHTLGFAPAYICYITGGTAYGTTPGQNLMMPYSSPYIVAGSFRGYFYGDAYTDASNITFRWANNTSVTDTTGGTVSFKYYLLQETVN